MRSFKKVYMLYTFSCIHRPIGFCIHAPPNPAQLSTIMMFAHKGELGLKLSKVCAHYFGNDPEELSRT